MVYRRRTRKKAPQRRRRRRQAPRVQTVQRALATRAGKFLKLRYVDSQSIQPGTNGIIGAYVYKCNSLYDPDQTGSGHQPMGLDQLALFYDHYCVVSAKITVNFSNITTTVQAPNQIGIFVSDENGLTNDQPWEIMEQQRGVFAQFPTDSSTHRTLSTTYSAKRFFNITDVKDNLDRLGALMTADPSEMAYFNVWVGNNSNTDTGSIYYTATIEFTAFVSEPKELPTS